MMFLYRPRTERCYKSSIMQRETCIVDVNKSTLRAQVKEMEFIYGSLYRLPYHSLPHLRTWDLFFFSLMIAEQGNHVKIPVILGCTALGLLYAYGNSLTIMDISQPITNRK